MKSFFQAAAALLGAICVAQELPPLPNGLCDNDTVYNQIRTGNVVEVTLTVRHRNCPSNRDNKPCRASNVQGFAPGPLLDGVQADDAIMVNDEIPGPEIRAKLGDTVRVNVINLLKEPTTMHFHGMTQFRTPFMDGDPMVSNCPIVPGGSHTYEFIAHPAGTTFYHSHSGSQRLSGMTGPLIIEDDEEPHADMTDRVVFIQDWYHENADSNFDFWGQNWPGNCITFGGDYFTGLLNPRRSEIDFVPAVVGDGKLFQSFIVNGQGMYHFAHTQINDTLGDLSFQEMQCPGQHTPDQAPRCEYCLDPETMTEKLCKESSADSICGAPGVIEVKAGKETRLRFIHGGALFAAQVCIDGHGVDIVAADGTPVEPYSTDCFLIFTAERYDVIVKPAAPGDYMIRMSTLDQQTAAKFGENANVETMFDGFPHYGYAILRVTASTSDVNGLCASNIQVNGEDTSRRTMSLRDTTSPIACDDTVTTNCGPNYWLSSKTMGCSPSSAKKDPDRCVTAFEALKPASSPNDDATLCGEKKMAHEVDATTKATVAMSFLPDEVPRWEGLSLNSRIEIIPEDQGFPYITPDDPNEWGNHQPISFVSPDSPPLSLSPEIRAEIYARRTTFRKINETNAGENFPNYPVDFSRGVLGANVISVNYGDVVRIYFSCAEPYGPGCAMPHPMHLHGHRMAVLYVGEWNETFDESKFNPNPVYRDTVNVNTDSFVVVQVAATNPGVWRWHCHVNIHHRSGMAMLLDVGGDEAVEAVRATPDSANLCPLQSKPAKESNASDNGSTGDDDSTRGGGGSGGGTSNAGNCFVHWMTLLVGALPALFHFN